MTIYSKAIAAAVMPVITGTLIHFGIDPMMPLETAIELALIALVTGVAVYFVPNKKY